MDLTVNQKEKQSNIISQDFEDLYLAVRSLEQRVYSDEQLLLLPDIDSSHIHSQEWKIRKRSCDDLMKYIGKKNRSLRILEIGCGNGWFSARLAELKNTEVVGLDINRVEIEQAKNVFLKENLTFKNEVFEPENFPDMSFDIILFAAAIQYFSSLNDILEKAQLCLAPYGEIHILDTNFYSAAASTQAALRTNDYYKIMGYPKMSDFYFHHQLSGLKSFDYKIVYNPKGLFNRLRKKSPFYRIIINKTKR
ncbi:class I SAM-dependent methyltransferase [Dyadobacter frigoris]|uniref:Class I SAM-dependent methyltransferase n=1 Tax=Dyadobacter frigoris TaxID=2576211 RepID=A0A4U6D8T3_9BACT|nr:methyltransferase domain-containing protein [Dyadobacter frigoris]TKT90604.1 class I SAM-dependent methyltransferase [Dyadobacter frigoris]GLU51247.1 hypothetical protein Dfri01_07080 [Dyadobacter frigoris]